VPADGKACQRVPTYWHHSRVWSNKIISSWTNQRITNYLMPLSTKPNKVALPRHHPRRLLRNQLRTHIHMQGIFVLQSRRRWFVQSASLLVVTSIGPALESIDDSESQCQWY
jgi:hypothetical protein